MILLSVVANGYALVTLIGAQAQNHDVCFPVANCMCLATCVSSGLLMIIVAVVVVLNMC